MKRILLGILIFVLGSHHGFAQAENYMRVKIYASSIMSIEALAAMGVNIEGIQHKPGVHIIGDFSEYELNRISLAGFQYEVLIDNLTDFYRERNYGIDIKSINKKIKTSRRTINGKLTPENFKLGSMGGYHTYQELLDELDEMKILYPDLISERKIIGTTTTIEGRPVYWVRISSDPENDQDKPKVLYTALTHAREPASMQQMLYQMWYYLENYNIIPEIKYLIDNLEFLFIPCVNPDGYIYNETLAPTGGGLWRKNLRNNDDGSTGVDLNRNFGFSWGYDNVGSSPDGNSMVYRGTAPFSEPETQLVKQFCEEREISLALNNHTYSDILIYPWGYSGSLTPDSLVFINYGKLLTDQNGYTYGTCFETLNYYANGGSDDWFYGEQQTKNKIMAFTPEAGKASDGFWPQVTRIEEICAGHTSMNLYMARFALAFAKVTDVTPQFYTDINSSFSFQILCLGIDTPSMFTVSLTPISSNIESVGNSVVFNDMILLQTKTDSIAVKFIPSIEYGEVVEFVLSVNNGSFTRTDTITKFFGAPQVVVESACNDMSDWISTSWGPTTNEYNSAPASLADSPIGYYSSSSNNLITFSQEIDLTGSLLAYAEFMARWSIEENWDYAQFMVSPNHGSSWIPLSGNATAVGGEYQDQGQPIYHGVSGSWIAETVSLNDYVGQVVNLGFRLVSDSNVNDDGFYFDDFKVVLMPDPSYSSISDLKEYLDVRIIHSVVLGELQVNWVKPNSFSRMELIDMQGRVVYSCSTLGISSHRLTTRGFVSGVYIVRLSGKNVFTSKLVL